MKRNVVGVVVVLAALGVAFEAGEAQQAQIGVFAGRALDERGGEPHGALTLAPSVVWTGSSSALGLSGQATLFEDGRFLGAAAGWWSMAFAEVDRFAAVVDGEGRLTGTDGGYRGMAASLRPRARLGGGWWRVEAGPQLAIAVEESTVQAAESPVGGGLLGADRLAESESGSRLERGWGVAGRFERDAIGLASGWRSVEIEGKRWAEWTLEGALAVDRVILSANGGARTGGVREEWVAGRLIGRLGSRASVVVEAGRSPSSPLTRREGGRYAALGLVVTTAPLLRRGT